jgi:hypothetical protein
MSFEDLGPKSVAICGSGLVGCLLGVYLRKHGFPVTIFESRPDPRAKEEVRARIRHDGSSGDVHPMHRRWCSIHNHILLLMCILRSTARCICFSGGPQYQFGDHQPGSACLDQPLGRLGTKGYACHHACGRTFSAQSYAFNLLFVRVRKKSP